MKYQPPTYEEYCKATEYAKIRYRFGVYIQLISGILLLFLLFYMITNIEEMKANPINYAEEKLGVVCFEPNIISPTNYDGSYRNITYIAER
jgi:hypothetical protein